MNINKQFTSVLRSALRICKTLRTQELRILIIEPGQVRGVSPTDELVLQLNEPIADDWPEHAVAVPAKVIEAALVGHKTELAFHQVNSDGFWSINGVAFDTRIGAQLLQEKADAFRGPAVDSRAPLFDIQLNAQFYKHLERVALARATDDIRAYLSGFLLDAGRRRLVATDGARLHCAEGAIESLQDLQVADEDRKRAETFICRPSTLRELMALRPPRLTIRSGLPSLKKHHEDEPPLLTFESGPNASTRWRLTSHCVGGTFPDTDRVVNRLPVKQQQAFFLSERRTRRLPTAASFPVDVRMPDYSQALDRFIKDCMAVSNGRIPTMVLDLRRGTLRSVEDAPVAFSQPVQALGVTEDIQEVLKDDTHAQCGVKAPYLRDAMKALGGESCWTVSATNAWQCADRRDLKVVVMPTRLGTGR